MSTRHDPPSKADAAVMFDDLDVAAKSKVTSEGFGVDLDVLTTAKTYACNGQSDERTWHGPASIRSAAMAA